MPTIDDKFVKKLDAFTKSLEEIVELLKEETEKGNTDVVNKMLDKTDDKKIDLIVKELKAVRKDIKSIKSDTESIKKSIKEIKDRKDKGLFDKISDKSDKKKIIDGIKVITLIAGGVLAIGMAFKIIGRVDPLSVIALGLAITAISYSFTIIIDTLKKKKIQQKDVWLASKVLPIMSLGIFLSAVILKLVPPLSFAQLLTVTFVAIALGASLYLMAQSLQKSKLKSADIRKFFYLPIILPLIALGITTSSWILKAIVPLSFRQLLTLLVAAGALGGALYLMSNAVEKTKLTGKLVSKFLLLPVVLPLISVGITVSSWILKAVIPLSSKQLITTLLIGGTMGGTLYLVSLSLEKSKLEKKDVSKFLLLPLVFPIMAMSIVLSSWVLKAVIPIKKEKLLASLWIGLSMSLITLALVPTIRLLSKVKYDDVMKGVILIPLIAGAVALSSQILKFGDYSYKIPLDWGISVGLTILAFGGIYLIGKFLKKKDAIEGSIIVGLVAGTVFVVSHMLSKGKYDYKIPIQWSLNVGLTLLSFGTVIYLLGKFIKPSDVFKGGIILLGISSVVTGVSLILALGKYDYNIPSQWSLNVGLTILGFGLTMFILSKILKPKDIIIGGLAVIGISAVIMASSLILSIGKYEKYPTLDWAKGVGLSIVIFGGSMFLIGALIVATGVVIGAIMLLAGAVSMIVIAGTILAVSAILNKGKYEKYPSIDWAKGVGLSIVTFGGFMILMGFALPLLALGALGALLISTTLIKIDKILSKGQFEKYPSEEWAKGVGLSIVKFGGFMILMGFALPLLAFGALGALLISATLIKIDKILSKGQFEKYPSDEWASGVGTSLSIFSKLMFKSFPAAIMTGILKIFGIKSPVETLAINMVKIAEIFNSYDWSSTKYPNEEWARNVGSVMSIFSQMNIIKTGGLLKRIAQFLGADPPLVKMAKLMVDIAEELDNYDWTSAKYPDAYWVDNISNIIQKFTDIMIDIDDANININRSGKKLKKMIEDIRNISEEIPDIKVAKVDTNELDKIFTFIAKVSDIINKLQDTSRKDYKNYNRLLEVMVDTGSKINEMKEIQGDKLTGLDTITKGISVFADIINKLQDTSRKDYKNYNRLLEVMVDTGSKINEIKEIQGDKLTGLDTITKGISVFADIINKLQDTSRKDYKNYNRLLEIMTDTINKVDSIKIPSIDFDGLDNITKGLSIFADIINELQDTSRKDYKKFELFINTIIGTTNKMKNIKIPSVDLKGLDTFSNFLVAYADVVNKLETSSKKDYKKFDKLVLSIIKSIKDLKKLDLPKIDPEDFNNIAEGLGKFADVVNKIEDTSKSDYKNFRRLVESVADNLNDLRDMDLSSIDITGLDSISKGLSEFVSAISGLEPTKIENLSKSFESLSKIDKKDMFKNLISSLDDLKKALVDIDVNVLESLNKFAGGMLVLSVIDEDKLESVIETLEDKKVDLSEILSLGNTPVGAQPAVQPQTEIVTRQIVSKDESEKVIENERFATLLKYIESIDRSLLDMVYTKSVDTPNNIGGGGKKESVAKGQIY